MSATSDILRTYRAPQAVMREILARGQREDRALAFLMIACGLIFVGQWPRLARQAALDDSVPFEGLLAGALFGWLFVAPIFAYGIAALSHLLALLLGGKGTFYAARVALFWPLLVTTPLFLLSGLATGFGVGQAALVLCGTVTAGVFLALWVLSMIAAERPQAVASAGSAH